MTLRIRAAEAADRARVLALLTAQLSEHSVQPTDAGLAQAVDRLLNSPELGRILVAIESGDVVGVAALAFGWTIELGGPAAWLEELYVDPPRRGRSVGTALVRAARDAAAAAGMKAIDLEVEAGHERAANLYRREGFARFEREHWRLAVEPARPATAAPPRTRTGGCLCGAVRYRANAAPFDVTHCHCTVCRRSTGGPFVTWATFPADAFVVTAGQPRERRSSPQAVRTFCPQCGTALTFREQARPNSVDVTAGSLDAPEALAPKDHTFATTMLTWLHLADGLPRFGQANPEETDCPSESEV